MSGDAVVKESELHAYLDGQLDPSRREAVEAYLQAHPAEAKRLRDYQAVDAGLQALFAPLLAEPVPARLKARPLAARWRPVLKAAAVAGLMVASGLAGWFAHGVNQPAVQRLASSLPQQAIAAHVVYTPEVLHPVEVGAEQQEHLVKWLSKRLGAEVQAPALEQAGFQLMGGRLLPTEGGNPAAQFMYQDSAGRRLTLYVRKDAKSNQDTAFRFGEAGGVHTFYWIDRDLGYALSGEVERDRLSRAAHLLYQQLGL
jgi:anti-sigma factor RsiW